MASSEPADSPVPGQALPGLGEEPAHTMALCGLDDVRSVPRDMLTPAR
jgi:4-hydroxymandelate oxidase